MESRRGSKRRSTDAAGAMIQMAEFPNDSVIFRWYGHNGPDTIRDNFVRHVVTTNKNV